MPAARPPHSSRPAPRVRLPRWVPRDKDPQRKVIALGRRQLVSWDTIEDIFFVLTTVACFWMAWQVWQEGNTWWQGLLVFVVVWAVVAYLAMPRLNRILTAIYVPDYFIGRTQATGGVLGDPINIAFNGSRSQVVAAMHRAGWTMAKPITLRSAWGIVVSAVTGRSDPAAPVSSLYLFHRMQDFCFEQEVDGNARKRHHVRFWKTPDDWLLPGGHRADWLAAGSYDRAVGLSLFTLQITHRIDADIDAERDHVVSSVVDAIPDLPVDVLKDFATGYHSRNGGGDRVFTDGNLPIVRLDETDLPSLPVARRRHIATRDVGSRPPAIVLAVLLALLSAVTGFVHATIAATSAARLTSDVLVSLAANCVVVVLAVVAYRGARWARVAILALSAVSLFSQWGNGHPSITALLGMGLDLAIMYTLTSNEARSWTRSDAEEAEEVHTGVPEGPELPLS